MTCEKSVSVGSNRPGGLYPLLSRGTERRGQSDAITGMSRHGREAAEMEVTE